MTSCEHLRLRSEFNYLRESGRKTVTKSMIFITAPGLDNRLRCGVICSRKFSKLAVRRNRARRLLYESFRLLQPELRNGWILMIPRYAIMSMKCQDVLEEMRVAAGKADLLAENGRF